MWWKDLPTWEKVVVVCMVLALLLEIAGLVWTFITFWACCFKKYIIHPLTGFAIFVAVFLAIAIVTFGVKHKNSIGKWKHENNFINSFQSI